MNTIRNHLIATGAIGSLAILIGVICWLYWTGKNANCVLTYDGNNIIATYYDDWQRPSSAKLRLFDLNGTLVGESYVFDILQYYPKKYSQRFKILDPKITVPSMAPKISGETIFQCCDSAMRLTGNPVAIRGEGSLWMTSDCNVLFLQQDELRLFRVDRDHIDIADTKTRPADLSLASDVQWVSEPTVNHTIFTSTSKQSTERIDFSELVVIRGDQIILNLSWRVFTGSISICEDDVIVHLSPDGSELVHRELHTGQVSKQILLPNSRKEVVEYNIDPVHNVLIADVYDRGIRLRYDLLDFSLIPDFGNVKISPDYANRYPSFVHWDRRAGIAWYSHHSKMIGYNRNNQVVKSIEQSFQISSACYSKSLNSIVVLGDKPLHWSVIKLDGTVDDEQENGSGQGEAMK